MENKSAVIEASLEDVERADNAYVVIAPFGFKKIEIGSKKFLQAMTREELIQNLRESPDGRHAKLLADLEAGIEQVAGRCVPSSGGALCRVIQGCRQCDPEPAGGGGWLCYCIP